MSKLLVLDRKMNVVEQAPCVVFFSNFDATSKLIMIETLNRLN